MSGSCPWDAYPKDPTPFCEPQLCQIIGQPANTWSNIGYFVAAYVLWKHARTPFERAFALVCLFLAIGSTLFHMSGALWAKIFDVAGMLMLTGLCLSITLARQHQWRARTTWAFYFILCAACYPFIPRHMGGALFLAQMAATVGLEAWQLRHWRHPGLHHLKTVLVVFLVALALNMMDQQGPLCWKSNHIFTVHGLWHLMTAYCIYRIAWYYRAWGEAETKR